MGILKLIDNDEIDDKIIAVPSELALRIIYCTTLSCIRDNYPEVLVEVKGWGGADEALEEIKKWSIKHERK